MKAGRIRGQKNRAPKTHMRLITLHLPPRWIEQLDSLVPEFYADRASAIRAAIRELLVAEVWSKT